MCLNRHTITIPENDAEHRDLCRRYLEPINGDVYMHRLVHPPRAMIAEAFVALTEIAGQTHPVPTEDQQDVVGGLVFHMISALRDEDGKPITQDYDHLIFSTVQEICRCFAPSMTLGRAQWVINHFTTTYYCRYWSELDRKYTTTQQWIRHYSPFFHIPVDGGVLAGLRRENPLYFEPTIAAVEVLAPEAPNARYKEGDQTIEWFLLDRDPPYLTVQQYVIDNLRGALSPVHRALRDLSPPPALTYTSTPV